MNFVLRYVISFCTAQTRRRWMTDRPNVMDNPPLLVIVFHQIIHKMTPVVNLYCSGTAEYRIDMLFMQLYHLHRRMFRVSLPTRN